MPSHPNSPGTGFIGLNQYLDANRSGIQSEAGALSQSAAQKADDSENASNGVGNSAFDNAGRTGNADPTGATGYAGALQKQSDAVAALGQLGSGQGVAQAEQDKYGKMNGGYTAGDASFDASLFGASPDAQKTFGDTRAKFGGLDSYLQDYTKASAQAGANGWTPPSTATPGTTTKPDSTPASGANPYYQPKEGDKQGRPGMPGTDPDRMPREPKTYIPSGPQPTQPLPHYGDGGPASDPNPNKKKDPASGF